MEVPPEILGLLANTQSIDQTLRLQAEERIRFFQNNELRTSHPFVAPIFLTRRRIPPPPHLYRAHLLQRPHPPPSPPSLAQH